MDGVDSVLSKAKYAVQYRTARRSSTVYSTGSQAPLQTFSSSTCRLTAEDRCLVINDKAGVRSTASFAHIRRQWERKNNSILLGSEDRMSEGRTGSLKLRMTVEGASSGSYRIR